MGDDNPNKKDTEKENNAAVSTKDDDASYDLFARLLIKRIVGFLKQRPSDFAITILPPPEIISPEPIHRTSGERVSSSSSLESLSSEHRSLLETSIVLMHDNPEDIFNSPSHLGLEARNLPKIAGVLRRAYRQAKKKNQTASSPLSRAEREELFHITSCLLLIQPDHATAWADRRRYLLSLDFYEIQTLAFDLNLKDEIDALCFLWSQELDYLDILVTQHSKAPSSWAHRKYVLRQMLKRAEIELESADKAKDIFFAREVKTCIDVAEKFPKNYYAWTHRRYLWDLFIPCDISPFELRDQSRNKKRKIIELHHQQRQRYIQSMETELMIGMWQEWLPKHPADHSAVHYSCQVLDLLLHEMIVLPSEEKIESVCVSALEQVRVLMSKFSHQNESLWILRRITYKTLWKHLHFPANIDRESAEEYFSNKTTSLVYVLVRNDLKSSIDVALQQVANSNHGENASDKIPNPANIHALTFIAWCIANLDGIDNDWVSTTDNFNCPRDDVVFTPRIIEIVLRHLTSTTGIIHHNHLVYTSSPSPISEILAAGQTKIHLLK